MSPTTATCTWRVQPAVDNWGWRHLGAPASLVSMASRPPRRKAEVGVDRVFADYRNRRAFRPVP
jgi:hypothetical protein